MASKVSSLLKTAQVAAFASRNINCWTAAITKKHREIYVQTYPVVLQHSDGSTINIQYQEPVGVIRLPLDLTTLTEEDKKRRLEKRKPKTRVKIEDEIDDDFDESRYLKFKKK